VDCFYLLQDRDHWWAVFNTAMDLLVLEKWDISGDHVSDYKLFNKDSVPRS
jgi:hypothetical protein